MTELVDLALSGRAEWFGAEPALVRLWTSVDTFMGALEYQIYSIRGKITKVTAFMCVFFFSKIRNMKWNILLNNKIILRVRFRTLKKWRIAERQFSGRKRPKTATLFPYQNIRTMYQLLKLNLTNWNYKYKIIIIINE